MAIFAAPTMYIVISSLIFLGSLQFIMGSKLAVTDILNDQTILAFGMYIKILMGKLSS